MVDKEHGFYMDLECTHCRRFFSCKGKPKGNKSCVSFEDMDEERKEDAK